MIASERSKANVNTLTKHQPIVSLEEYFPIHTMLIVYTIQEVRVKLLIIFKDDQ